MPNAMEAQGYSTEHGKDHSHTYNYRPISLTSNIGKLMEQMVMNRFSCYRDQEHFVSLSQWISKGEK